VHPTDGTAPLATSWPVLRSYEGAQLDRIILPIGGIGTGTIGLGGRGDLRQFEIGNRPAGGFRPGIAFLAMRVAADGEEPRLRLLEGPLADAEYEGRGSGSDAPGAGWPRFSGASFEAAYPFGQVRLSADDAPPVTLRAFNPLIPCDVEASSWPVAVLRVEVVNDEPRPIEVTIAAVVENFIGSDGTSDDTGGNRNEVVADERLVGVRMTAPDLESRHEAGGEFVVAAVRSADGEVTVRPDLDGILEIWDDLLTDGRLDPAGPESVTRSRPVGGLAHVRRIPSGESAEFEFLLTWRFPNRRPWAEVGATEPPADVVIGNHYADRHPDAWQTARELLDVLPGLEARSVRAVSDIVESAVPLPIREAALFNLGTMRTQTVFRTPDGRFWGWEGITDREGSCHGNCNHVWAHEFATSHWFAEFARSFRETQYELATDDTGLMSFRVGLPIERARAWGVAAADGQMACLVHLYRDWRLSGDDEWLRRLWPAARRSLEFAWIPGGWDADRDGVMEGCQHFSLDGEYFGPSPQTAGWYLAALRACAEMASHLGDEAFAIECRELADRGARWVDEHLFTGAYYRQIIAPIGRDDDIAPGLVWQYGDRPREWRESADDRQLGDGVLIDQLTGQYAARAVGLGTVLDPDHVSTTLGTIFERNFRTGFGNEVNSWRVYVLGDESGTLICTYPQGRRPKKPLNFFSETMTGFEHAYAAALVQDGQRDLAVRVVDAVRSRHDGRRRNPFDEAEAGRHYARAMSSWTTFQAWNGFDYDGRDGTLGIDLAEEEGSTFWSTGSASGSWHQSRVGDAIRIRIDVVEGAVLLARVATRGRDLELPGPSLRTAPVSLELVVSPELIGESRSRSLQPRG
jgi:uncharacterized protein (DUF608 family)